MSDRSEQAPAPLPEGPKFVEKNQKYYDVEYADISGDIVYHFWPKRGEKDFPLGFAKKLEDAYKTVLPLTATVYAEYTDRDIAAAFMRFNAKPEDAGEPVPTYYVRVVGWADNPMSDKFLRSKVFEELDSIIERSLQ